MSFWRIALALGIVVVGVGVAEEVDPRAAWLLVAAILLGAMIAYPQAWAELAKLAGGA